jgi:hypothetical protein
MLKALRDPDVQRALGFGLAIARQLRPAARQPAASTPAAIASTPPRHASLLEAP